MIGLRELRESKGVYRRGHGIVESFNRWRMTAATVVQATLRPGVAGAMHTEAAMRNVVVPHIDPTRANSSKSVSTMESVRGIGLRATSLFGSSDFVITWRTTNISLAALGGQMRVARNPKPHKTPLPTTSTAHRLCSAENSSSFRLCIQNRGTTILYR